MRKTGRPNNPRMAFSIAGQESNIRLVDDTILTPAWSLDQMDQ